MPAPAPLQFCARTGCGHLVFQPMRARAPWIGAFGIGRRRLYCSEACELRVKVDRARRRKWARRAA